MKYQVIATMMFNEEADAVAFMNLVEEIKTKNCTDVFTGGIDNDLRCQYFHCFHDEVPPKQCVRITSVDFKAPKVEIKTVDEKVIKYNSLDVTTKETITEAIK